MGKKKKILILSGLILLLVAGAVGAYFGFANRQPASEEVTSKLYWNADRDQYIPELGGDTIRKPEKDGLYTVRFLVEGEIVEYRVADRETMISVDEKAALGLEIDKDGIITKAIDIRDMGIREVAKSFYVQTMQDNVVVANSSVTGSAVDVSLRLSSESKIWNVTGLVDPYGVEDKLQLMDCIRAFNNDSGAITDIFIVEREEILNGVSAERYCDHCEEVVTWRMWLGSTSLPYSSGHFRLITDVELPDQYSMPADIDVVFDLNGKTISRKTQGRIISLHSEGDTLSIIDGSEEKTGMIKAFGEYAANGGVIWVRYGTFNMYAGTINASEVINAGANGAAIQVNPDTTFNMYGGTIIGGTAKPAVLKNEETGEKYTSGGMGGSIYCQGTINMYGGEILDGKVASAKDHKGEMAGIAGGNIALISKGIMNMSGGKIAGGKVVDPYGHGGNISVRSEGAVLNISGGEIVNGVSMLQAGNVASWGTITMTGGTIKGGKNMSGDSLKGATYNEASTSHNMFLVSSKFDMSGGTVEGHIGATNGLVDKNGNYLDCNIIISGTAKIKGAKTNLTAGSSMIHFGKLSGDAYVSVNGSGFISTETVASNQKYVHSDYEGSEVLHLDNKLFIGKQSCVCGLDEHGKHFGECDGTLLAWRPWTKATYAPYESGNWYLLTDVESEGINEAKPDATIRLDLNGKKIVGKVDRRVYSTVNGNVNLTITDLSKEKNGSIIARSGDNAEGIGRGGCVWVTNKKSKVTFYGGVLDGTKVTALYNGAAVSVDPDCTFTMYGGTINGGKAVVNKKGEEGYAGTVFVRGQFNLHDGVIQGGSAEQYGGNIYVHSEEGAKFHMTGGKVIDGKANNGGNISGMGPISIAGGTVADGEADYGGNISARRQMIMTGGEIKDGVALGGGNIYASASSDLTISGGTISGGKAIGKVVDNVNYGGGGNLRVWTDSKLNISNATIKNGVAQTDGGNIYLNNQIKFTMTNATITGGKASRNGGNICIGIWIDKSNNKDFEKQYTTALLSGGTIRDGYAQSLGGNMYVENSNTTLSGAITIVDGTKGANAKEKSNMYLANGVTVTLNGLTSANSSIGVNSVDSTFATDANIDKSDVARFFSDEGHSIAQTSEHEIFFGRITCMCGYHNNIHKDWCTDDLHDIEWHAWRRNATLPDASNNGRYYYLTSDVKLNSTLELKNGGTWGLDLNGKKVSYSNRILSFMSNVKCQITDTSAEQSGMFTYNEGITSAGTGMLFFVNAKNATVDFYTGTIDGAGVRVQFAPTLIVSQGTFVMHDGMILPGNRTGEPVNEKDNYQTNCVEVRGGTLDVRGGTIEGELRITTNEGKLNVSGDSAKVGVAVTADTNKAHGIFALHNNGGNLTGKVVCDNVNVAGGIVFKNTKNIEINGTGETGSFTILDKTEAKYNHIADDNAEGMGNLKYKAKMRTCGDSSCTGSPTTHDCVLPEVWKAWSHEETRLPLSAGAYYLTGDMEITERAEMGGPRTTHLDLNGKTVTKKTSKNGKDSADNRVVHIGNAGAKYTITDSSSEKSGMICFSKDFTSGVTGELFFFGAAGTINIYGGQYDMSNMQVQNAYGEPVRVMGGTLNIYDGTFMPAQNGDSTTINNGFTVEKGEINVYGGRIYGQVHLLSKESTLFLSGDVKVGVRWIENNSYGITTSVKGTEIICDNVSEKAIIKLNDSAEKTTDDFAINGTGEASAFEIVNHKHNVVVDDNDASSGNLSLKAKLRTCGNVICTGNSTTHDCDLPAVWQSWSHEEKRLPLSAGAYYLTGDMEITERAEMGGPRTTHLDLNGKIVTKKTSTNGASSADNRVVHIGNAEATYTIADSSSEKSGKICFSQDFTSGVSGELFFFEFPGRIDIYGGQYDMGNIQNAVGEPVRVQTGTLNIYNGTFKPANSVASTAIGDCFSLSTGTINVYGGKIYGRVILQNAEGKLTLKENVQVGLQQGETTEYGVEAWTQGTTVKCDKLTEQAKVIFRKRANIVLSETENSNTPLSVFEVLDGHFDVVRQNGELGFVSIICVCGENVKGKDSHSCVWTGEGNGLSKVHHIYWTEYTGATDQMPSNEGYYYLTKPLTLKKETKMSKKTCLDLNGKTITASPNTFNIIIDNAEAHYEITDSQKGEGTIKLPQDFAYAVYGGLLVFRAPGQVTLYNGKIDMTATSHVTYQPIDVAQGTFTMHGGEIKPAKESESYNCIVARSTWISSANQSIYGHIIVTGGTICGDVFLQTAGNTLTISGDAQVGVPMNGITSNGIKAKEVGDIVNVSVSNLTDKAKIVFASSDNIKLSEGYEIANVQGELLLQKKVTK